MEFLDPKAKKRRTIRLVSGYLLVSILILTSSLILVFSAYGFDVDRETGEVIQNGLVYVDSAPDNAQIFLNGQLHNDQTNTRLSLPEGDYKLEVKKDGYRTWTKDFKLNGGSVERITYPLLVPNEISRNQYEFYGTKKPIVSTQSPDRRWLLQSTSDDFLRFVEYDLNNFNKATNTLPKRTINFPASVYSLPAEQRLVEVVDWSRDNKNFLIKHVSDKKTEYIVLNRDKPEESININRLLGLNPTSVRLDDKKHDKWFLYFKEGGILQRANKNKELDTILSKVVTYESYGEDDILYARTSKTDKNLLDIVLMRKSEEYLIKQVKNSPVKLNLTIYDNDWYLAVGSEGDKKNLYI